MLQYLLLCCVEDSSTFTTTAHVPLKCVVLELRYALVLLIEDDSLGGVAAADTATAK